MNDRGREPIKIYLSGYERAGLDRVAAEPGIITRPRRGPGDSPPSLPIAPLSEILAELDRDRTDW